MSATCRAILGTLVVALAAGGVGCKSEAAERKAAGNVLFNQGKYAEARDEYARAVAASPDDPGARTLLGNALLELHEYGAARAEFEAALRADPAAPEAHRGIMTVIAHTATPGDPAARAEFISHAEAIIAARPKDKNAIINAGMIVSEAANPADAQAYAEAQAQAETYLRRALEIDDRDPKLLFHLALVYARKGEVDVALRVVDRIEQVQPEPGLHLYTAAIVHTIAGDHATAVERVERLLEIDGIDPASLLHATSYLKPLHGDAAFVAAIEKARARRRGSEE